MALDETGFSRLLTILIVEDEYLLREMAIEWLREAGYQICEASNGEEAAEFLNRDETIDVLFTDIRLGGAKDGWDIAEAFRRKYPLLPVIYCSGYMTKPPRIVDGGLFLTKPYAIEELVGACRKLTNGLGVRDPATENQT